MMVMDIATFRLCLLTVFVPGVVIWCLLAYAAFQYWSAFRHEEMTVLAYEGGEKFPHTLTSRRLVHGVLYIVDRPLPMSMGVVRDISFVPTSAILQSWLRALVGTDGDCGWRTKRWMKR